MPIKSIKSLPVRIICPKGKKCGRPSKIEWALSEMISKVIESPEFKKEFNSYMTDIIITGTGMFNTENINADQR